MEVRAGRPPTKKITVRDISWIYPSNSASGFAVNGYTLYPDDVYDEDLEEIRFRSGLRVTIRERYLWREIQTREVDVPLT